MAGGRVGGAGGRGHGKAGNGGGGAGKWGAGEKEVLRLKDRVVEQDALLRNWHQHIRRLMRERDGLKRRLSQGQVAAATPKSANGDSAPVSMPVRDPRSPGSRALPTDLVDAETGADGQEQMDGDGDGDGDGGGGEALGGTRWDAKFRRPATQQQQQQLAEQLRQLHVLVDQLVVHEVSFSFTFFPPYTPTQSPHKKPDT